MAAIVTLLVTVTISLLVTRVGAIALALTGLSREVARFQARSAFTGVGFTTTESESIVNHPVRRRILMMLMFWGNIGVAAVIASTIASFTLGNTSGLSTSEALIMWGQRLGVLFLGIAILWLVFTSRYIDEAISQWVEWALLKWTNLDVRDYTSLLHLHNGYVVMELQVNPGDWMEGKDLAECNLASEGVLILGINRHSGQYVGSPNGNTKVQKEDVLTLYGPVDRIEELDIRKRGYQGDRAHRIAVQIQQETVEAEPDEVSAVSTSQNDPSQNEAKDHNDQSDTGKASDNT